MLWCPAGSLSMTEAATSHYLLSYGQLPLQLWGHRARLAGESQIHWPSKILQDDSMQVRFWPFCFSCFVHGPSYRFLCCIWVLNQVGAGYVCAECFSLSFFHIIVYCVYAYFHWKALDFFLFHFYFVHNVWRLRSKTFNSKRVAHIFGYICFTNTGYIDEYLQTCVLDP